MTHNHSNQRRALLRSFGAGAASLSIGAGASLFAVPDAKAQAQPQGTDYRALVCLFMFGGNDGLNTVIPMDDSVPGSGYADYAAGRKSLASAKSSLVALSGSRFGLHPSLSPLASIWNDQAMAVVHNVGPLSKPMTQSQYVQWRGQNDANLVPESLFSHSDQQRQWENGASTTIAQTGWGGAAAEQNDFNQVISFGNNTRFGTGLRNNELVLPEPGGTFGLNGYWTGSQPDRSEETRLNSSHVD